MGDRLKRGGGSMVIVGMVARSPNQGYCRRPVDTSDCRVEGILKGIGSTTQGSRHIIKCIFDIFIITIYMEEIR